MYESSGQEDCEGIHRSFSDEKWQRCLIFFSVRWPPERLYSSPMENLTHRKRKVMVLVWTRLNATNVCRVHQCPFVAERHHRFILKGQGIWYPFRFGFVLFRLKPCRFDLNSADPRAQTFMSHTLPRQVCAVEWANWSRLRRVTSPRKQYCRVI
jgi:hypothetical protein